MSEIIITAEMKEDMKKCNGSMACGCCKMPREFHLHPQMCIEALASLPGVWDEAPIGADYVNLNFYKLPNTTEGSKLCGNVEYTRTLPKSLEDEIAEKYFEKYRVGATGFINITDTIKAALKEYNERQLG